MTPNRSSADASTVRVALAQMVCGDNRERNLEDALRLTVRAAEQGARVVCLPELFLTRYFCQREDPEL